MDIQQSIFTFMIHSSNTLKSLAAFVAGLLVLACTPTVIPELSLSDLAANFEATGSLEKSISVTSNVDWTVSCPDAWVTVSPRPEPATAASRSPWPPMTSSRPAPPP